MREVSVEWSGEWGVGGGMGEGGEGYIYSEDIKNIIPSRLASTRITTPKLQNSKLQKLKT